MCRREAVALKPLKHPRITCCDADGRTSYPGITPLYWRAERSEWGAAGKDQRWFGLRSLAVRVIVWTQVIRPRRLETVPCPLRRTTWSECVKNTLIGRETEHRQSRWIKSCCFISICPQQQGRQRKLRWFVGPGDTRSPNTFDFCCRHLPNP